MQNYLLSMVAKFETTYKVTVKPQMVPFLLQSKVKEIQEEAEANGTKAKFGEEAASPRMAGLYSARSCRPDLNVSTLMLARRVTKWNASDDARLLHYLGYIKETAGARLRSQLDTKDLHTAVLRIWLDADLAGDPEVDAQSSGGDWIELASQDGA